MESNEIEALEYQVELVKRLIKCKKEKVEQLKKKTLQEKSLPSDNEPEDDPESDANLNTILNLIKKTFNFEIKVKNVDENKVYAVTVISEILQISLRISSLEEDNVRTNIIAELHNMELCYLLEFQPCLDYCVERKNLSLLFKNATMYTNKFNERASLIDKLIKKQFVTIKSDYQFENGGLLLFIYHDNSKKPIAKCQWLLSFSLSTLSINHEFDFANASKGEFTEKHADLLTEFNSKNDNHDLIKNCWIQLFKVIHENHDL